ncbi:MAG: TraB/GumN family protein [Pseudorhodobacter sp.]
MTRPGNRLLPALIALITLFPMVAGAQCQGQNLLDKMKEPERQALQDRAHAVPYAEGNLWRATRDGAEMILAGTFHLGDPRHDETMAKLTPHITRSRMLLVEAGPKEQEELSEMMTSQPDAMFGDGILPALSETETKALVAALEQRGFPAAVTGKLRPWFLSMMLALPPCAISLAALDTGLDQRLITAATAEGKEIRALEPFDTALRIFDGLSPEDQIAMVRQAMAVEPQAEDLLHTGAEAYFAGQSRLIWELNRHLIDQLPGADPTRNARDLAQLEEALVNARNRSWVPVLIKAVEEGAAEEEPIMAAFGALHLPGEQGVLALLEAEGFTIAPLSE